MTTPIVITKVTPS
jgi:enoyl-CoA hydratase/carnithine racemase